MDRKECNVITADSQILSQSLPVYKCVSSYRQLTVLYHEAPVFVCHEQVCVWVWVGVGVGGEEEVALTRHEW